VEAKEAEMDGAMTGDGDGQWNYHCIVLSLVIIAVILSPSSSYSASFIRFKCNVEAPNMNGLGVNRKLPGDVIQ